MESFLPIQSGSKKIKSNPFLWSFTRAPPGLKSGQSNRERNGWTSNIERPTSNVEWMYSIYFKKDFAKPPARRGSNAYASESDSILRNSLFVIRYSAVRCLIRVIQATRLIIKKPCHFGVVSYELPRSSSWHLKPGLRIPLKSNKWLLLTNNSELHPCIFYFSCLLYLDTPYRSHTINTRLGFVRVAGYGQKGHSAKGRAHSAQFGKSITKP